jgi:hypothetical protein
MGYMPPAIHRCIVKFKALCRLGEPKQADPGRGAGGRWALVLEYAKVSSVQKYMASALH